MLQTIIIIVFTILTAYSIVIKIGSYIIDHPNKELMDNMKKLEDKDEAV